MSDQLFDAVLFDLDGVLTSTTALHAASWKQTFEEVVGEPFDAEHDYLAHVDGKPREAGVRDFLASRGIDAPPERVREIANHKQGLVEAALAAGGVEAYAGSVRWLEQLRDDGVLTAVVTSSANSRAVLEAVGLRRFFDVTVDGTDIVRLGLAGKPAPDGFLEAARRLGVAPRRAVVVEDALAGVAAGRAGEFGLVIGVARSAGRGDLRSAGADVVVDDLAEFAS